MHDRAVVPRETTEKLGAFCRMVERESQVQNLVSPATIPHLWERHIVDSLQLIPLAARTGTWADIGTGAGFPGLVVAIVRPQPTILIEPRRLRADFLRRASDELNLENVLVIQEKVERVHRVAAVVSARAVTAASKLFGMAKHLSTAETTWLIPTGRSAERELEATCKSWQGRFSIVPSSTDPQSGIIVAEHVAPRRQHP